MFNRKAVFQIEEEPQEDGEVAVRFVSIIIDDASIMLRGREDFESLDERDQMKLFEARDKVRENLGSMGRQGGRAATRVPQRVAMYWESQGQQMRMEVER